MKKKFTYLFSLSVSLILSNALLAQHKLGQGGSLNFHTAVIYSTGKTVTWGLNDDGQLGTGDKQNATTPQELNTAGEIAGKSVVKVSSGRMHTLALTADGLVYSWGSNGNGQLGTISLDENILPILVNLPGKAKEISAGLGHSLAVLEDGSVYAWGMNIAGQLGTGNNIDSKLPVKIPSLSNIMSVTAGEYFSLALATDGSVYGWGVNFYGETNSGKSGEYNLSPVKQSVPAAKAITCSHNTSYALLQDGTVMGWGGNDHGELGSTDAAGIAYNIGQLSNVKQISAGYQHVLALKTDGTVTSWGANSVGQLGVNTVSERSTPVQVLTGVKEISTGYDFSLALMTEDCIKGWGGNWQGQLGNGTIAYSQYPPGLSFCLQSTCTKPVVNFTYTAGCLGTATAFTNLTEGLNNTYAWDVDNDGVTDYSTSNAQHIYTKPGTYSAKLTVTSLGGCSESLTLEIVVTSGPVVNAGADALIYNGYAPLSKATLTATSGEGTSYLWSNGATTPSIVVNPKVTTEYTVTVKSAQGCAGSDAVVVNVLDVRCGAKLDKVTVCNSKGTDCVPPAEVPVLLRKGYKLGACQSLAVNVATSVADLNPLFFSYKVSDAVEEKSIKVLNSPTSGSFKLALNNLNYSKTEIQVVTSEGVIVEKRVVNTELTTFETFNLFNQASGLYYIKVITANQVKTAKVLVAH